MTLLSVSSDLQNLQEFFKNNYANYHESQSDIVNAMSMVKDHMLSRDLAAFSSIAVVLAGLICAGMMLKFSHDYLDGRGLTLWEVLRPLLILVVVSNFNSFVIKPLDAFCGAISRPIERRCYVSWRDYSSVLQESMLTAFSSTFSHYWDDMKDEADKINDSDAANYNQEDYDAEYDALSQELAQQWENGEISSRDIQRKRQELQHKYGKTSVGEKVGGVLKMAFLLPITASTDIGTMFGLQVLNLALFFLMKIVMMGQQIYAYVYLIIFGLLGPFTFALGMLPSFRNSISSWIARYIQVSMWIPIGYIIMTINMRILMFIGLFCEQYDIAGKYIVALASIVSLLNIRSVPKIAAYIVESTGTNDAHSNINAALLAAKSRSGGFIKKVITRGKS